ncbi:MAG: class I SAM-dependent methyltransferase, partial [Desulfobacteraceae bacterium]|nr:class I SAM-dependent methyltransferase [Desulfobacteraceae bacterium]
ALGFKPIAPEEAMEALARILARPLHQILILKAAERLLQRIGVSDSHRIERYPVQMPSLIPHTTDRITPPEMGRSKIRQLGEAFSQLQQFGRFLLLDAFQRMGIFGNRGETYPVSALRDRMNLEPGYQGLLEALIRVAEESGFVRRIDGTLTTTPLVDDARTRRKTASLEKSRDQLAEAHPDVAPHAKLLWNCLSAYPEVLSGAVAAVDILFPHASTERVDALYKGNAGADHYNRMAATAAEAFVADRLACGASDHPLRILEIGAGTGGTSQAVLEAISDFKDRVTYDYTDISLRFLQHGRKRFGHHRFVRFQVLDIEGDPVAQGYPPAHFDLVIAANVLHATRSIRRTISHAKRLLKTNGWLLLNEVTGPFEFATLTFGLTEGWWRYEDGANRLPGGPLIGVSDWQRLLAEEGFDATAV